MLRLILVTLTFTGNILPYACSQEPLDIQCDDKLEICTLDLGVTRPGTSTELDLSVRNVTDQPLQITGLKTSCGCTKAEANTEAIPPKGEKKIAIGIKSSEQRGDDRVALEIEFTNSGKAFYKRVNLISHSRDECNWSEPQNGLFKIPFGKRVALKAVNYGANRWENVECIATSTNLRLKTQLSEESIDGAFRQTVEVDVELTEQASFKELVTFELLTRKGPLDFSVGRLSLHVHAPALVECSPAVLDAAQELSVFLILTNRQKGFDDEKVVANLAGKELDVSKVTRVSSRWLEAVIKLDEVPRGNELIPLELKTSVDGTSVVSKVMVRPKSTRD